jgi:hypothetical protein
MSFNTFRTAVRVLQQLTFFTAVGCGVLSSANEDEVVTSMRAAAIANTMAYRNFEVSFRTQYETTSVTSDKQAPRVERKHHRTVHGRLWIDYETERCVFLEESMMKKESTNPEELAPQKYLINPQGEPVREIEVDYRKGQREQEVSRFQDGQMTAKSMQAWRPLTESIGFWKFIRRRAVPRIELAAIEGADFLLSAVPLEEYFAARTNPVKLQTSQRRLQDGTLIIVRSGDNTRLETFYPWNRVCPDRSLIFETRNGVERLVTTREKTFDDFDLVDRPAQCKITSNYLNQASFETGEKCDSTIKVTMDFHWRQFNAQELNWPDFEMMTASPESVTKVVTEGWNESTE